VPPSAGQVVTPNALLGRRSIRLDKDGEYDNRQCAIALTALRYSVSQKK
jgi:hypothetical protein